MLSFLGTIRVKMIGIYEILRFKPGIIHEVVISDPITGCTGR